MRRAIKTHMGDFAAIIVLLVLSIGVAGYILSHERFRFPFIDSAPYTLNAEFSTAQAVTPGQGQSVRVSGVQIGEIGNVSLKNGVAIVQMQIDPQYKNLIHTNATALLRPKTGLKDMFVEVQPGSKSAPVARQGGRCRCPTRCPMSTPTRSSPRWTATPATISNCWSTAPGRGCRARAARSWPRCSSASSPPTRTWPASTRPSRSVARICDSSSTRCSASTPRSATTRARSCASSTPAPPCSGRSPPRTPTSARHRATCRARWPRPPTRSTRSRRSPSCSARRPQAAPAAKALPAANAAVTALAKPSAPIVQNQIRPFVVAARPLVRNLKPAAENLAAATPGLTKTFDVVKRFGNMLGYNPGDTEHGYLWWLAWLDHNARTLFSVQDANGDFRPLFLQASCATYSQLVNGLGRPRAGSVRRSDLLNLTPILTNASLCPSQAAANRGLPDVRGQEAGPGQHHVEQRQRRRRRRGQGDSLHFDPKLPVK